MEKSTETCFCNRSCGFGIFNDKNNNPSPKNNKRHFIFMLIKPSVSLWRRRQACPDIKGLFFSLEKNTPICFNSWPNSQPFTHFIKVSGVKNMLLIYTLEMVEFI